MGSSDDHRGVLLVRGLSLLHVQELSGDLDSSSTINAAILFATKCFLLLLCRWIETEEILILVVIIYYVFCTYAFLCTHTFAL